MRSDAKLSCCVRSLHAVATKHFASAYDRPSSTELLFWGLAFFYYKDPMVVVGLLVAACCQHAEFQTVSVHAQVSAATTTASTMQPNNTAHVSGGWCSHRVSDLYSMPKDLIQRNPACTQCTTPHCCLCSGLRGGEFGGLGRDPFKHCLPPPQGITAAMRPVWISCRLPPGSAGSGECLHH